MSEERGVTAGAGAASGPLANGALSIVGSSSDPEAAMVDVSNANGCAVPNRNEKITSSNSNANGTLGTHERYAGGSTGGDTSLGGGKGGARIGAVQEEHSGNMKGEQGEGGNSNLTGIAVCVVGAVMSSMLQFSFVYGKLSLIIVSFVM